LLFAATLLAVIAIRRRKRRHADLIAVADTVLITGAVALSLAFGVKAFYSRAGARTFYGFWRPRLARFVGGVDLIYEPGAGFISHTHHLAVGPACAGVNFLVICFLCLYFSFAQRFESQTRWFIYSLLISFGGTVAANGLRIFVSAHLWDADIYGGWMTRELMHRLAGVAIYYASLLTLYCVVESRVGTRAHSLCSGISASRSVFRWLAGWLLEGHRDWPDMPHGS
jgi:exosortase K